MTWLVVAFAQAAIGYTQYFSGVPAVLVGVHVASRDRAVLGDDAAAVVHGERQSFNRIRCAGGIGPCFNCTSSVNMR